MRIKSVRGLDSGESLGRQIEEVGWGRCRGQQPRICICMAWQKTIENLVEVEEDRQSQKQLLRQNVEGSEVGRSQTAVTQCGGMKRYRMNKRVSSRVLPCCERCASGRI